MRYALSGAGKSNGDMILGVRVPTRYQKNEKVNKRRRMDSRYRAE